VKGLVPVAMLLWCKCVWLLLLLWKLDYVISLVQFPYSTYFLSIISISFHNSTCLSSIFFHILSLSNLPFFHIFHIISQFNLLFFNIFQIISLFSNSSWIVKRYGKYRRKVSWIVKRYGNYGRKGSWIVKRFGKDKRKL
jgi:hypothetical protein